MRYLTKLMAGLLTLGAMASASPVPIPQYPNIPCLTVGVHLTTGFTGPLCTNACDEGCSVYSYTVGTKQTGNYCACGPSGPGVLPDCCVLVVYQLPTGVVYAMSVEGSCGDPCPGADSDTCILQAWYDPYPGSFRSTKWAECITL